MEIFKQLSKKGYKHYYGGTIEELDSMDKNNQHLHSEIMQVIMWLYEKHRIWITSEPCIVHNGITNIYKIFKDNYLDTISRASKGYNSPTEAYEAAIKYTLKNLIKNV